MNRVPRFAFLLAGAGFSAVLLGACGGPTAPPGDAGFGMTTGWGTGGSYYGSGGSYGTGGYTGNAGGYPGSTGGYYGGGTGGYYGGGTGGFVGSWDAGGQQPFDSGTPPPGGGGGPPGRGLDAGTLTACPPDAMNEARCIMGGVTCIVPAVDGGRQQICTCRTRNVSNIGNWRCYQP